MAAQPHPRRKMIAPQLVWAAADELAHCPPDRLDELEAFLADHVIELRMRPPDAKRPQGATAPQLDLWDAFFKHEQRIYACAGGNQSSKTVGVGVCYCQWIRDYARNGDVYWMLAQSGKTQKDIPLKTMYELLPRSMFPANRKTYDPTIHEMSTLLLDLPDNRGKAEVWWFTEEQGLDKIESSRVNGIWWSECQHQTFFEALLPRMLARGGWMLMDYVPFQGWHRTIIREKANQPGSPVWWRRFVVMDNAHNLSPGAIDVMKASMSEKMWEIRGLGKEAAAQGAVYQNFDPDVHVIEPFAVPDFWPLFLAGDWGFNAPHAFGLFTVSPNETLYLVAEEYREQMTVFETVTALWEMVHSVRPMRLYPGCRSAFEMFEAMREQDFRRRRVEERGWMLDIVPEDDNLIREHVESEFGRVLAASVAVDNQVFQKHGGSTTLAMEFMMAGLPICPAVKGRGGIDLPGVETVRRMLDTRKLAFFNTCPRIREDHVAWMYKTNKDQSTRPVDKYEEDHKHGCDAVRYLLGLNPSHAASQLEVA